MRNNDEWRDQPSKLVEGAAEAAYLENSHGVTTLKWKDLSETMKGVWLRTAAAVIGHLDDRPNLRRPDGKEVSRLSKHRSESKPPKPMFDPELPSQIWGEPVIDRTGPARFAIGLDAAQRPTRLFMDNVEISRQVSEINIEASIDSQSKVTLEFVGCSVVTIDAQEMPHNPRLRMRVGG